MYCVMSGPVATFSVLMSPPPPPPQPADDLICTKYPDKRSTQQNSYPVWRGGGKRMGRGEGLCWGQLIRLPVCVCVRVIDNATKLMIVFTKSVEDLDVCGPSTATRHGMIGRKTRFFTLDDIESASHASCTNIQQNCLCTSCYNKYVSYKYFFLSTHRNLISQPISLEDISAERWMQYIQPLPKKIGQPSQQDL